MADDAPTPEHVHVEFDAGVCTITFARPRKKNALTVAMYRTIVAAFAEARERKDVRVLLIRGSEGCFTAGNDLVDFMKAGQTGNMDETSPVVQLLQHLVACEKPIVAAVQGPAVGLGVTMLLHCDLIYAGESARFQMPFVNLGLCPEAASSFLLPRVMGYPRAAELILLGERFSAEHALSCGIINQVLADEVVIEKATEVAHALAKKPPRALRVSKQLMRDGYRKQAEETMEAELVEFAKGLTGPEAAEAMQAFFQKREPDFSKFE